MRSPVTILVGLLFLGGVCTWLVLTVLGPAAEEPGAWTFPEAGNGEQLIAPPLSAEEPPPAAAEQRVLVEVAARARILPPRARPELRVLRGNEEVPAAVEVIAGAGAGMLGASGRPGASLVRLHFGDGLWIHRRIEVAEPLGVVTISIGDSCPVVGRVVGDDRQPVAGATLWWGLTARDGSLQTAETDADGVFDISVPAGEGIPLVVWSRGFAAQVRWVSAGIAPPGEQLFVLGAGASLEVRVAAVATHLERGRVLVVPRGAMDTALLHYPFFLQAVVGWQPLGADGVCRIDGLPRGATVGVVVHHPLAVPKPPVEQPLLRDRQQIVVPCRLGAAMAGRVLDPAGEPVAGALIVSSRQGREISAPPDLRWLLPPDAFAAGGAFGYSDSNGRFLVGRGHDGGEQTLVRVMPRDGPGLAAAVQARSWRKPLSQDFQLAAEFPADAVPTLRLLPPASDGDLILRIKPYYAGWRLWPRGQPFEQPLSAPAILDIDVRIERDGAWEDLLQRRGQPVTGVLELDLSAPRER